MEDLFVSEQFESNIVKKIHLRIQQNGKNRQITSIEGLDNDLDLKLILKALKKEFKCSGMITNDKEHGEVIQLQGDHRKGLAEWLVAVEILTAKEAAERIVRHGF
jgi:translation initiation factor 1